MYIYFIWSISHPFTARFEWLIYFTTHYSIHHTTSIKLHDLNPMPTSQLCDWRISRIETKCAEDGYTLSGRVCVSVISVRKKQGKSASLGFIWHLVPDPGCVLQALQWVSRWLLTGREFWTRNGLTLGGSNNMHLEWSSRKWQGECLDQRESK